MAKLSSLARNPENDMEMLQYLKEQNQPPNQHTQPMNTIRVDSTGEYLTPQGRQEQPYQFQSARQINLNGRPALLDNQGNIEVETDHGKMFTTMAQVQQNAAEQRMRQQIADMPRQKQAAEIEKTQAEAMKIRGEAAGGVKPQFSPEMGGYVYPPNAENPQGMLVPLQGAPKQIPKLTEGQAKATTFASQMAAASNELDKLEAGGFDPTSKSTQLQTSFAGGIGNIFTSPKAQQAKQTQNQWSEAFLRVKTGAAATEPEVQLNNKTFFPQIGDSPDVINQKRQMRVQAEQDVLNMTGAGRELATQRAQPQQGARNMDQEAVAWANANPSDPRSAAILRANAR